MVVEVRTKEYVNGGYVKIKYSDSSKCSWSECDREMSVLVDQSEHTHLWYGWNLMRNISMGVRGGSNFWKLVSILNKMSDSESERDSRRKGCCAISVVWLSHLLRSYILLSIALCWLFYISRNSWTGIIYHSNDFRIWAEWLHLSRMIDRSAWLHTLKVIAPMHWHTTGG